MTTGSSSVSSSRTTTSTAGRSDHTDYQVPAVAPDHTEGVADSVVDVLFVDAMLARAIRDLH